MAHGGMQSRKGTMASAMYLHAHEFWSIFCKKDVPGFVVASIAQKNLVLVLHLCHIVFVRCGRRAEDGQVEVHEEATVLAVLWTHLVTGSRHYPAEHSLRGELIKPDLQGEHNIADSSTTPFR